MLRKTLVMAAFIGASMLFAQGVLAQSPLPAAPSSGTVSEGKPATYAFNATVPGFLSLVLRGDDTDLMLFVTDADGQALAESDDDVDGRVSAEQLGVALGYPGTYTVRVEARDGKGDYKIGSAFLPFPELARKLDPDQSPRGAMAVEANKAIQDSLDPSEDDSVDWFVFKAPAAGSVTAATRNAGSGGDLALEAYEGENVRTSIERSDSDMQGDGVNESVTLAVKGGQSIYLRVSEVFSIGSKISYRLSIAFIPD